MSSPRSIFTLQKELGSLHNQLSPKVTEHRLSTPEYEPLSTTDLTTQKPTFASPSNIGAWTGHSQTSPKASHAGTVDTNTSTALLAGRKRSIGIIEFAPNNIFPHSHCEPLHKRRRLQHILR